ncbi:MAG: S-adenosylmethionine:tRNA ribosyltransferase-isomerase [Haliscomenobacter sp.]|uniref:S-adenosylmethionine:tRNA ribosyltransferase-isomerase n=1 Tax=Haliscomenobacter sp. TaxID=2717303 RepID=UPI0029A700E2|nr:S-adenosylmethionine:tRNA ribosyltransferase-isomerase [Haliscomenobacter sp.]MDX2067535.1 S-adenosylmethionine:tRNA ribosyltransferase-isomerase [Haliscomenobacter sp.]
MKVQEIRIEEYQYDLPEERIAKYPLAQRDASKLLVFHQGELSDDVYTNLDQHIPKGALMLFNNTKVIPARLHMAKPTGGIVEIFCLEPLGELGVEMAKYGECEWNCLVGGAKKWKEGPVSATWGTEPNQMHQLSAEILERGPSHFSIRFHWQPAAYTFAEVLSSIGQIPLPPYLDREAEELDRERYQTIYANLEGSVAAPTAGLHFTPAVFSKLENQGIDLDFITLHVGAGTFKPVSAPTIGHHDMHAEYFDASRGLIQKLIQAHQTQRPVVAVGTTTLRTLESLYLMGCKLLKNPDLDREVLEIRQWDAYELERENIPVEKALQALLGWLNSNDYDRLVAKTQLLIAPGYPVKMINGLCTNFHQPGSTLLLLVAALVGEEWKKMYQYALDHEYRFLSYGDGCYLSLTP